MPRLGRRVLAFVVTAGCAALAFAQYTGPLPRMTGETEALYEARKALAADAAAAAKLPRPDLYMDQLPKAYPRTPSSWRAAEKAHYAVVLAQGRFDVLVVPFQVQDLAFSQEIRSLMTAQLALAMTAAGSPAIPDPYVVARALGDGERRYDLMEVLRLANRIGAKRVVLGYVGHQSQKKGTMRVTLNYFDRGDQAHFGETFLPRADKHGRPRASERTQSVHFEDLAFSSERTPLEAYEAVVPGMVRFLGLQPAAPAPLPVSRFERGALPASPLGMVSGKAEPARDAYYLQLLATLAPTRAERVRGRLVEKSMLALQQMSPQSPDYRALKARALLHMGMRPAAIRALGAPATAEERHLAALLNGNLPEIQANRKKIAPGVRALLASLEENAVAAEYRARTPEKSLAEVPALKLPGDVWQFLTARALTDWDLWSQHANLPLKGLLDVEFPLEGFTAEGMVRGAAAVGDAQQFETQVDLSVLDHVRRHVRASAAKACCQPLAARPGALDYLDLLESIGTDNLARRARFLVHIQGQPQSALAFIARIEGVYKDHPQVALVRADAELKTSGNVGGAQRDSLRRSAFATAFNAWYWEQGQTRTAADAFEDVITKAQRNDYGHYDNLYVSDYPFRSFYPFWQFPGALEPWMQNGRAALENSAYDFEPLSQLESSLARRVRWDEVDALLKSVENRFVGNSQRVSLLAAASERRGDTRAAERHYRDSIRAQPSDEASYASLGKLLFEDAAAEDAAQVFMSYPGLAKPDEVNPVGLSNYAFGAGSYFYWSGQFKLAIPLYQISAKLRTGSDSSIAAETRLALIEGDYAAALRGSLERGQRYRSHFAYRDALGLLHAMGRSADAWDGFNSLVGQMDHAELWETALVGLQVQGTSEKDIAAWLAREPMRSAGRQHARAPMFLLRAGVIDRTPSADLAALIAGIERPVWKLDNVYGHVVRPMSDGHHAVLGPKASGDGTLPGGVFEQSGKTRVKSDLVLFAEAYRSLRMGAFAAARASLFEASKLYDMTNEPMGYLLPYYAYAAARSGDTAAVEAILDAVPVPSRRFDYHLSKAVLAAHGKRVEESMRHLDLALHRRPFTGRRPVYPEYQYAELCEWLFEATRNPSYRDAAIAWAKQNQTFQPWFAWPYAVEAKLATDPAERRRAIAMAHYLDRNSERLASLPKAEVDAALKESAHRNPFKDGGATPKRPI